MISQRLLRLLLGLVLYGVSIALMLGARLGVDSWDVFHQGVAVLTEHTFGRVAVATSIAVLLLWVPLRQRPGLGTVANALVVGPVVDLTLHLMAIPATRAGQLVFLGLGVLLNGVATGLYIGAGLGPGPRDGLMTGLARRTGRSLGAVRTGIELTILVVGWSLGGPLGVGTVLYAVSIGPLAQFFIPRLAVSDGHREQTPRHIGATKEICT